MSPGLFLIGAFFLRVNVLVVVRKIYMAAALKERVCKIVMKRFLSF